MDETAVRRAPGLLLRVVDIPHVDIASLTSGQIEVTDHPTVFATVPDTLDEHPLDSQALAVLTGVVSGAWTPVEAVCSATGVPPDIVMSLVEQGLLLQRASRSDGPVDGTEPNDPLAAAFWHPFAAGYHFNSKWRDENVDARQDEEDLRAHPEPQGEVFYEYPSSSATVELPLIAEERSLYQNLHDRRTCRSFDEERTLPLGEFAAVLYHSFGATGLGESPAYPAMTRTSPSGGAMHPTEAFLLLRRVDGLLPGLYHYNIGSHRLDLIRATELADATRMARVFVAGQSYFASAHALCVLAARFYRQQWKYRYHPKSYRVLNLDVGHLSQTLYLTSTARGLGAFLTAAINDVNIEEEFGLDPWEFGVMAVAGFGIAAHTDPFSNRVLPYSPPRD